MITCVLAERTIAVFMKMIKLLLYHIKGYMSSCYSNNSDNWNYNSRYQINYEYLSNKILSTSPEDEGEVNLDEKWTSY